MRKWLWMMIALAALVLLSSRALARDLGERAARETKPSAAPAHPDPSLTLGTARRFTVRVTPEMLRHSRLQDVLYFVDFVYGAAILLLVLATRISARLRDVASRAARWPF